MFLTQCDRELVPWIRHEFCDLKKSVWWVSSRAILCQRTEMIDSMNDGILDICFPATLCVDSIAEVDQQAVYQRSILILWHSADCRNTNSTLNSEHLLSRDCGLALHLLRGELMFVRQRLSSGTTLASVCDSGMPGSNTTLPEYSQHTVRAVMYRRLMWPTIVACAITVATRWVYVEWQITVISDMAACQRGCKRSSERSVVCIIAYHRYITIIALIVRDGINKVMYCMCKTVFRESWTHVNVRVMSSPVRLSVVCL